MAPSILKNVKYELLCDEHCGDESIIFTASWLLKRPERFTFSCVRNFMLFSGSDAFYESYQ